MLLRKMDLWSAFMSLYLPVIQHAGMLQTTGGSALFLPTCLGCFISESLKGRGHEFCDDTKSNPAPTELCKESNEHRATGIAGGLNDYNG
jgi:hypothetical protein